MISGQEIQARIAAAIPDAQVRVNDLTGGQDHYEVEIVSPAFDGLSPLERHRKVYGLFGDVMGGALHALSIAARTPEEASP